MAKKSSSKQMEQMQNNLTYTAVVLGILVIVSLGMNIKASNQLTEIQGQLDGGVAAPSPRGDSGAAPTPSPTVEVSADDDPVKGDEDAPITIIEFGDFQCPFCGRFYSDTLSQLESEYIDTGKVKLVYRDLPLRQIHPQAQLAAEAAECADDQGMFWEYHDHLYENQGQLSQGATVLKQWADDLGLDTGDFNSCLDSGKYTQEVNDDLAAAQAAGATGTPTFFINGQKLVGAHPFSTFKQAIDAQLN